MTPGQAHPQIISRQRVADHGEVYTRPQEVRAMLDLVKDETQRIDSTFLEPACGTGNFLAEVLQRKLAVVNHKHRKSGVWEQSVVVAVGSLYGIDILPDNVRVCRQRLAELVRDAAGLFCNSAFLRVIDHVLAHNIICGDALTLLTCDAPPQPIIFSEWKPINSHRIRRSDYSFSEILGVAGTRQSPLFSDLGEKVFIPRPIRNFPAVHYLELPDAG